MARKFEATRDLPEPPVVPVEKDIAPPKHHPTHLSNGGATVTKGGRTGREHDTYIGFANLPNQVYRKSVKKGFDFTLMLIGEWDVCMCVYVYLYVCISVCVYKCMCVCGGDHVLATAGWGENNVLVCNFFIEYYARSCSHVSKELQSAWEAVS